MGLLFYPYFIVAFWYRDFFLNSLKHSLEIFIFSLNLLSVRLLLITFFRPLKNEYREGLVLFSVLMGVLVKSAILLVSFFVLSMLAVLLFAVNVIIIILPILIIKLIFI